MSAIEVDTIRGLYAAFERRCSAGLFAFLGSLVTDNAEACRRLTPAKSATRPSFRWPTPRCPRAETGPRRLRWSLRREVDRPLRP